MGSLVPKVDIKITEPMKVEMPKDFDKPIFVPDVMKPKGPLDVVSPPFLAKGTEEQMTITPDRNLNSSVGVKYMNLDALMAKDPTGKTYMAHQMLQSAPSAKTWAALGVTMGVFGLIFNPGIVSWIVEHGGSFLGWSLPFLGMVMGGGGNKIPRIRQELTDYGNAHQLRSLEGRIERGLDPAGMLAVTETRAKVEQIAVKLGAPMEGVISLTNDLHVGGIWKNTDRLAVGNDPAVQVWMILGEATNSGKQKEGDLTESEFISDTQRVDQLLDEAAADPQAFAKRAQENLIEQSQKKFVMDGDVPVSDLDDGFLAMAVNGQHAGIVKDANGLLFVGAEKLDYSILAKKGLHLEERDDRGRKATFYVNEKGEPVVKKLYDGFAIVLSKDMELAKTLSRSGEAQYLLGRAEVLEREAEMYFIEGWDGVYAIKRERANKLRQDAKILLDPSAKFFQGNDGHGYQVRGFNEFSERPKVYNGEHVMGRRGKHRELGGGRLEVAFEVFDTEVAWKRDEGAREVKIEMSRAEFDAKGLSDRTFRYYILTPDTPPAKSPITLETVGDERAWNYILKDQEGRIFMSIDTHDTATADQIHLQVLENYQQTGSLAMAIDWLNRSPWKSDLYTVLLPTAGDAAPMGIFGRESDFVGLGFGYQTKNEDASPLASLKQSPWDPSSDTVVIPNAGDAVFSFSPPPFRVSLDDIDDITVTGSDGPYWPPETHPDLHATPPTPPAEITARSEGGRDYRIVTHQLTDRYYPHTTLVWVKDPSDIVLQPGGMISVTFQETLTEKKITFTLKPSEAATLGLRPGERPETHFTLWK